VFGYVDDPVNVEQFLWDSLRLNPFICHEMRTMICEDPAFTLA